MVTSVLLLGFVSDVWSTTERVLVKVKVWKLLAVQWTVKNSSNVISMLTGRLLMSSTSCGGLAVQSGGRKEITLVSTASRGPKGPLLWITLRTQMSVSWLTIIWVGGGLRHCP